jgi:hypothetical protein
MNGIKTNPVARARRILLVIIGGMVSVSGCSRDA